MRLTVDSEEFNSLWYGLILRFSPTAIALLLYGVYVNLFLLSIYTLSRRRTAGTTLLIAASCMMAVIGTTQIALDVAGTVFEARLFQQFVHAEPLSFTEDRLITLKIAQQIMLSINNFITDCIFMYRCYVIWGSRKKAIILPMLLMLLTSGVAMWGSTTPAQVSGGDLAIPFGLCAITNVVLTVWTACRILWIRRTASLVDLDRTIRGRYTRATVIILESGAAYCIVAIFLIISALLDDVTFKVGIGLAQQLLNIVPTFTLVYIGLKNMTETSHADLESCHPKVPTNQHTPLSSTARRFKLRRRSSWPVILDIKLEETEGRN
ncbi:hypothetical protein K438DRAFT_1838139 [Mycena galopus ATCC 62051]|nr:hypothetical protein K438DRAFT_1838139 [Mycena galopus ATCC 62051]